MGTKTRIAAVTSFVLIAAIGLWYIESPVWTLSRMKDAAEASDPAALNSYIDYPALRESLKEEVSARMMSEAQKDKSGLSGLTLTIGAVMVGPAIDAMVTPAGMRAALRARRNQEIASGNGPASVIKFPDHPVIKRRGISAFLLTSKEQPGNGMLFKRDGLSWKLSGVELSSGERQ